MQRARKNSKAVHHGAGLLLGVLALSGCLQTGTAPAGAPTQLADGQANLLKPGMSTNDAFGVFGPESGFERNPADWDLACLSYAYGSAEAPRYVHAYFRNDMLERATDGHAGLCTFASVMPEETV